MRRDFQLPAEDARFLEGLHLPWEAILQAAERWMLVHEHPLPDGYDHETVTVATLIWGGYAESPLDMFFLYPALTRIDRIAIPASDTQQALDGKTFQRWSRHRPGDHPWRPGVDNLETHFVLIRDAFDREFVERPRR